VGLALWIIGVAGHPAAGSGASTPGTA